MCGDSCDTSPFPSSIHCHGFGPQNPLFSGALITTMERSYGRIVLLLVERSLGVVITNDTEPVDDSGMSLVEASCCVPLLKVSLPICAVGWISC